MKIIAKKVRRFIGNKNGLIKPIFKIDDNSNIAPISIDEYPNSGQIFFSDYELLDSDIKNEMFLMDNCFFISDDNGYEERHLENSACKKRINYNVRISSYFKKIEPNKFIPIYSNNFSVNNNEVESPENIISDIFFLKNISLNRIFGPFERNGKELKAANFKFYEEQFRDEEFLNFIDNYERKFESSTIFEITIENASNFIATDNDGFEYLEDFKVFIDNNIGDPIDFTPIASLHKWAIEKLEQKSSSVAPFLKEIKNIVSIINSPIEKLKWKKYINHLENIENDEQDIEQLVKILNDKNFIEGGISSNEIDILEKEKEDIKAELDSKDKVIITLKDRIKELNTEIEEEKSKKKDNNNNIDSILYPLLSEVISINENLSEIENLIASNKKLIDLEKDFWKLEGKKETFEKTIESLQIKEIEIRSNIESISNVFKTDAKDYTAKLAEAKIYTDLLNGIEILPNKVKTEVSKAVNANIIPLESEINSAKVYILEIQKRLVNQGRELSFNDVANLVITINQSFISIIAGAPGVGKTSLVEKLSNSYGLNENFGYLEIACAKGWTSSKDLIGFFNPLTNKFQSAKTKLKEALKKSEENLNAPYIVLLDEANLSPIEHYWSDFIKLADTDYPRKIKISEAEEIQFGEGFRFVATINHDHTTESLSNRLIDRASIIQLDKPNTIIEINDITIKVDSVFDFVELQKLFIETPKWKTEEELIKDTFNKIKEKLESNHTIILSPRKEIAIYKYCKVATGLLEGNSYVALDYAISQHVLPLINGRGETFEALLKSLKSDLSDKGMAKSEKLLHKIIERGRELKHFRYIYY